MRRVALGGGRASGNVLRLDTWKAEASAVFLGHVRVARIVDDTSHGRVVGVSRACAVVIVVASKAAHTGPTPRAAAGTLAVPSQGVAAGELSVTLWTNMRLLSCVKFGVSFQIVQAPEAHLAVLAEEWFFLTMSEEVTL